MAKHKCKLLRRSTASLAPTLAAQLASNSHVPVRRLPAAPPSLTWTAGSPGANRAWLLVPLISSLFDHTAEGGLARFYAHHVGVWQRWREHFSAELALRGAESNAGAWQSWRAHFSVEPALQAAEMQPPAPTEEACVELLRGDYGELFCPTSGSGCPHVKDFPIRSQLRMVDHLNLEHPQPVDVIGDVEDVKVCACGYAFMDTSVGKHNHMLWCERLRLTLSEDGQSCTSQAASAASVSMFSLTSPVCVAADNKSVGLGGNFLLLIGAHSLEGTATSATILRFKHRLPLPAPLCPVCLTRRMAAEGSLSSLL